MLLLLCFQFTQWANCFKICLSWLCFCSDSGDSLFITQKPVPEALRTGVRTRYSQWAKPLSPRDLHESEESEENKESSDSNDGESQSGKVQRSKKNVLPKFSFPFLKEKKPELLPVHNKRLHVRITNNVIHTLKQMLWKCNSVLNSFLFYRVIWWEASLNVSDFWGRAVKQKRMWSPLYQLLTWMGSTYLNCQSKFIRRNIHAYLRTHVMDTFY